MSSEINLSNAWRSTSATDPHDYDYLCSWAIVQFEAAIAFLQTDPLKLMVSIPSRSPSPAVTTASLSPTQPKYHRSHSHDSIQTRSRRASIQSLPSETMRAPARSPVQPLHPGSLSHYHQRTISSLPATRVVTYQHTGYGGRRSSVISTITTTAEEEAEDNATMGPPSLPKRGTRTSTDEGQARSDLTLLSHSRNRTISSYSLASTELQIRPQILRPQAIRPPTRSFHISQDLDSEPVSQPTRIPLERSQTTPYNARPTSAIEAESAELARSGSDGSRRASVDWWAPLRYSTSIRGLASPASPPVPSDHTSSPRPDSPASPAMGRNMERSASERSSFDLERSSGDITWLEWGRKRLSSITSAGKPNHPACVKPYEAKLTLPFTCSFFG